MSAKKAGTPSSSWASRGMARCARTRAAAAASRSGSRPVMVTAAPRSAACCAICAPMPELPPMMTTVRLVSDIDPATSHGAGERGTDLLGCAVGQPVTEVEDADPGRSQTDPDHLEPRLVDGGEVGVGRLPADHLAMGGRVVGEQADDFGQRDLAAQEQGFGSVVDDVDADGDVGPGT